MNADEIVKALREAPNYNAGTGTSTIEDEAADCIEALQAQLAAEKRRADAAEQWATEFYAMLNRRRLLRVTDKGENAKMDLYDKWRGVKEEA